MGDIQKAVSTEFLVHILSDVDHHPLHGFGLGHPVVFSEQHVHLQDGVYEGHPVILPLDQTLLH